MREWVEPLHEDMPMGDLDPNIHHRMRHPCRSESVSPYAV